jgi:hypothetical protein
MRKATRRASNSMPGSIITSISSIFLELPSTEEGGWVRERGDLESQRLGDDDGLQLDRI